MTASILPFPVADLHCDTVLELQGGSDIARNPEGHVDLPRLAAGSVGLQVFAAFVSSTLPFMERGSGWRCAPTNGSSSGGHNSASH